MWKFFDKTFFKLAFQFLVIVVLAFGVLFAVGFWEVSKKNIAAPNSASVIHSGQ